MELESTPLFILYYIPYFSLPSSKPKTKNRIFVFFLFKPATTTKKKKAILFFFIFFERPRPRPCEQ
jgi:hypothetical protein